MASANSPRLRFSEPVRSATDDCPRLKLAAIAACVALVAAAVVPAVAGDALALLLLGMLCLCWQLHLRLMLLPWFWNVPLTVMLGVQFQIVLYGLAQERVAVRAGALASGTLVYLMIWTLAARHRRGLQAIASTAFLLALTLFGRIPFVICGLFLSGIFLLSCRRRFGSYSESALLIFTPAGLCVLFASVLRFLDIASVQFPILQVDLLQIASWRYSPLNGAGLHRLFPSLEFALGVIVTRSIEGRVAVLDLAYCGMLLCLFAATVLHPGPDPIALLDLNAVIYAGGMCLIAVEPPQRFLTRLSLIIAASGALVAQLR